MTETATEDSKKKGVLTFEEMVKNFTYWSKGAGLSHPRLLAVDILVDAEDIGYIAADGSVTISGHVIESDPARIMSYSNTLTLDQWVEIGVRAGIFKEKCSQREFDFAPVRKKLEGLAVSMFPENGPFGHIEIAVSGRIHFLLGCGKGEWEVYPPGIYTYEDNEVIKNIGYRPVSEQRITTAANLSDNMLTELVRVANSIGTLEG